MKIPCILFSVIFLFACTSKYLNFNEELVNYTTVKNAILLHEKPFELNHSYELIAFPLLGYACYEFSANPKSEDFRLPGICQISVNDREKLYKQLLVSLERVISECDDSVGKLDFLNFLEKYKSDLFFVYKNNYPPIIHEDFDGTYRFFFYGLIYCKSSKIVYCVRVYDTKFKTHSEIY